MQLALAQTRGILEACGLLRSEEQATHRLEIRIEPMRAAIRVGIDSATAPGASFDVEPGDDLWECDARNLLVGAGLSSALPSAGVLVAMFGAFRRYELLLLDVDLCAAGARLHFSSARALCDDTAAFRNPAVAELAASAQAEATRRLKSIGIDYVQLVGPVALLSVGAGETMAAMDLLAAEGCPPACFLDASGGFDADSITAALRQIQAQRGVRAVLVNVFGGVTRVDRVAESLLAALERLPPFEAPFVVRLEGTEAERGRALVAAKGLRSVATLRGAIAAAVAAARGSAA
jgi:succinyl-CoA synthetase beta subunit